MQQASRRNLVPERLASAGHDVELIQTNRLLNVEENIGRSRIADVENSERKWDIAVGETSLNVVSLLHQEMRRVASTNAEEDGDEKGDSVVLKAQ